MKAAIIILAAGASRRMGRPKLLLPWGGKTILEHLIGQWRKLGVDQIAVVHAKDHVALIQEMDRLDVRQRIVNPRPDRGMFSSIQCAAQWGQWEEGTSHWVLCLGDQPQIRPRTLRLLLEAAARHPEKVAQPGCQGRARHPVVFPREVFMELGESGAEHLKAFLQARDERRYLVPCEDAGLELDLDTPEDYRRAMEQFGAS